MNARIWAVVSVAGILITILMIVGLVYWMIKRKAREESWQEEESLFEHEVEMDTLGPRKYKFKELKSATDDFNTHNELGRGGFGVVYKGMLKGQEVAVKRVMENSKQGRKNMIAEITTIGGLHHRNLVKLVGWCYEMRHELLLVYEYMPNGSLDKLLFLEGETGQDGALSWGKRYNIVCGVARSLDYLHNDCSKRVLHRDIKPSNVMLGSKYNARLGDFGLAKKVIHMDQTHLTTSSNAIAGTLAYMAPKIFHTGKATTQTDIYAFGVLVLEVVCGRRSPITDEQMSHSIVNWVWEYYKSDMICSAVDPKLNECFAKDEAERVLLTGLACCHLDPSMRPSIRNVLQVLLGEVPQPSVPREKPEYSWSNDAWTSVIEEMDPLCSGGVLSSLSSVTGR